MKAPRAALHIDDQGRPMMTVRAARQIHGETHLYRIIGGRTQAVRLVNWADEVNSANNLTRPLASR